MGDIDNGPTSIAAIDYSTGDQPRRKTAKPRPIIVKVTLPKASADTIPQARIVSRDGKIDTPGAANLLQKRFAPGERSGYFFATLANGQLEIGDRAPTPADRW